VYRHFRSRRLKVHINRATDELKQCVVLLNRLRNAWWSAGTMADLGTAVLNNADRNTRTVNTPATIADPPQPRNPETKTEPPVHNHHLHAPPQWQHAMEPSSSIDPRLQNHAPTPHPIPNLLNPMPPPTPGQHPTSSERAERAPLAGFDFSEASPDWLNFDAAFENFEGLLGSSGADLSNELFRPLNYDEGFMGV
jgi:hypothetical protein